MPSDSVFNGSVVLVKALAQHDVWLAEPFNRAQAWVDLLLLANDRPRSIRLRGVPVHLDRGQLAWSTVSLAERWRWGRPKVSGFLEWLSIQGMISLEQTNVTTLITVKNYAAYQGKPEPEETPSITADVTANTTTEETADKTPNKTASITAGITQKVEVGSKEGGITHTPPARGAGQSPPQSSVEGGAQPEWEAVLAFANGAGIEQQFARDWFQRKTNSLKHGFLTVRDWRFDLSTYWQRTDGGGKKIGEKIAVNGTDHQATAGRHIPPALKEL